MQSYLDRSSHMRFILRALLATCVLYDQHTVLFGNGHSLGIS